jgi:hypothetical protein
MKNNVLTPKEPQVIYKVNGHTFYNTADLNAYIEEKNFLITDHEAFDYKGKTVICINVKSK